jgi:hypothetical protein
MLILSGRAGLGGVVRHGALGQVELTGARTRRKEWQGGDSHARGRWCRGGGDLAIRVRGVGVRIGCWPGGGW